MVVGGDGVVEPDIIWRLLVVLAISSRFFNSISLRD